jgi:hypothetical protein
MNKLTILVASLAWLATGRTHGQAIDSAAVFAHMHGLEQAGVTFYEAEGYVVTVASQPYALSDKTLPKLKRKYKVPADAPELADPANPSHRVFVSEQAYSGGREKTSVQHFSALGTNLTRVISLYTSIGRDPALERFLVGAILAQAVPPGVVSPIPVDSVRFAGRYLHLGPRCRWMDPHNLQCPNYGQMNWFELRDQGRAAQLLAAQMATVEGRILGELKQRDSVDVVFEGVPTKALKGIYKFRIPQAIMGGSNVLVVYYVLARVRNRYVACVLSHYTDDVNARSGALPPLLAEVMRLGK